MDIPVEAEALEDARLRPGMGWGGHVRATILLALPLIGAQIGQMAMNIADTVMVGRLGATELAAVVLGTQAFFFVFIFGTGFAQAVMPLAAAAEGHGNAVGVRRSVRMGLWVLMLYSVLGMPVLWQLEPILLFLGQEPEVAELAGNYIRVAQWSMFPVLFLMGMRSYLAVIGKAHILMWVTIFGVLLNIALNYAFIYGNFGMPALGIVGAAVATLLTNIIGAILIGWYALKAPQLSRYELFVRFWRPEWPAFREVLRLGWPIGLTIIAEVGLFGASSIMVGWIGTVPLAAHGIALQITSIAFMVPLGMAAAGTIRIGAAHGQGDTTALARAGWSAAGIVVAFSIAAALVFWLFAGALVELYLDADNVNAVTVVATAIPLLYVAAAFQIVDGLQCVSAGLLRGLRDTRVPMLIAVFSYWMIGMPAAYGFAFPLGFGPVGIWFGLAAGLAVAAALLTWRFSRREQLGLLAH